MPLTPPTPLRNERTSIARSDGLVAALLTCAAVPVLEFGQRLRPEWNGNFLLPAVFLIAHAITRDQISLARRFWENIKWA